MNNFNEELKDYANIVEEELQKYLRSKNCPEEKLNDSMEYSLMSGGKRIRGTLIIATYKVFKDNFEVAIPFAVAIEMIHNFSLIHDDLPAIDNDDLRRGKPTNHKKFGESTAILAGDGLLNNAYMVIAEAILNSNGIEQQRKIRAFREFSEAVDKMIIGEFVDTEYEGKDISSEYLEYIHNNKTGALITVCCRIGAILAGAIDNDIEKITEYSQKIGLAFQIRDDILSVIGNEEVLGKPIGNDKKRGKCTYVKMYGLEKSKEVLSNLTSEAVNIMETYEEKGKFLKELALYMENRNK